MHPAAAVIEADDFAFDGAPAELLKSIVKLQRQLIRVLYGAALRQQHRVPNIARQRRLQCMQLRGIEHFGLESERADHRELRFIIRKLGVGRINAERALLAQHMREAGFGEQRH